MHFDVYIGQLEDPHTFAEGGSIPKELSKLFPGLEDYTNTIDIYNKVCDLADSGELAAEQTWWQCTVVTVTRDQLLKYLDEWYGEGPIYPQPWTTSGEDPNEHEIRTLARGLDPGKNYVLVAFGD